MPTRMFLSNSVCDGSGAREYRLRIGFDSTRTLEKPTPLGPIVQQSLNRSNLLTQSIPRAISATLVGVYKGL